MPELLAAASILVAIAGALSLLLALPAVALVETVGEADAASRARTWLAALILPPIAGSIAACWALMLHAQGLMASPHLGGQRPHLCLLPLSNAPAGAYRLHMFCWFALALVALAVLRLISGAFTSHLLRRLVVASGAGISDLGPQTSDLGPPTTDQKHGTNDDLAVGRRSEVGGRRSDHALVVDLVVPTSFCAGLLRPVAVISSALLDSLGAEHLRAIIAHELGHATRRDNLAGLIADACTALLVLLPTAHFYRQQWRAAAEAAADDQALLSGVGAEALLEALETAERTRHRRQPQRLSLISLLVPPPATTTQRIRRLAGEARLSSAEGIASGDLPSEARSSAGAREMRWRQVLPWIALAVGVGALALLVLVSRQSVEDSLYCAAEQLIRASR